LKIIHLQISKLNNIPIKNMDFEEFFRKKKIDLVAFGQGEPALFSEFKIHYDQMGEKSFDHTKKYWFNKLRLRFPAPPEVKVEKVMIENTLAEQTVTESLIESSSPPPNIGFKPKFRAGVTKPAEEAPQPKEEATSPPPNVGFKPRFKAGVTKPAEEAPNTEPAAVHNKPAENTEQTAPPATLGFKPKFKAGITKTVAPEPKGEAKADETPDADQTGEIKPKEQE
jgi:hypothetical protein